MIMTKEELENGFTEYAIEDIEGALQLVIGLFIGLNVAYCDIRGGEGNSKKKIIIEGPEGQRKITIHAAES